MSIRRKLFTSFSVIFILFTILVLLFQYQREKDFRTGQLENTLDNITELTHQFIAENSISESGDFRMIDSLVKILPGPEVRVTVISPAGLILFDSEVSEFEQMENHLDRPEVKISVAAGYGASIRESATTGRSYYYYAKYYTDYFIRTAALYDLEMKDFLHVERLFIFYLILLFLIVSAILQFITRRFSDTITKLKDFTIKLSSGVEVKETIEFPKDELGTIGSQITAIYKDLNEAKENLDVEKNKLYSHLSALNEGIAFFSSQKQKVLANSHFIQNLNLLYDKATVSAEKVFEIKQLEPIHQFIDQQLKRSEQIKSGELPMMDLDLQKSGRYFNVKCVFFQDRSFEIAISDTTKLEKRRMIKQQMTSNIAHELKTPVSSVMGYLETLQHNNLEPEKKSYFIDKAHAQAKRLSDLIEDISTLNKIEEAGENFTMEPLKIGRIVEEVEEHLEQRLLEKNIKVSVDLSKKLEILGNESLLFSVFYNLFDNVIKYGGDHIEIKLSNYLEDKKYFYFAFANTGSNIDEAHLARIFERFYRIDDGRSRKTGGTGLGLAIVKNAIQLHNGEISARQYKDGGIEFLFSLAKG
ncbi:MAG: HAMP domain-containing sensor histidine kinase [Bacteroides sp.]|nr:HAMP domain-containing sensor histidine kinase [Bacteroides sp.]